MRMQDRESLVAMLRAAGEDLMKKANQYVPENTFWLQNFIVHLEFGPPDSIPSMKIELDYIQQNVVDISFNE